jgi:hypothetical protein
MDGGSIPPPLSKSDNLQDTNTRIERDGEDVTDFDPMAGRFLARPVDPDMPLSDQRRGV